MEQRMNNRSDCVEEDVQPADPHAEKYTLTPEEFGEIAENEAKAGRLPPQEGYTKVRLPKSVWRRYLFVAVCLIFPVFQFVLTWAYVNIDSILLAFQRQMPWGDWSWTLDQFAVVFNNIFHSTANSTGVTWLNDYSVQLLNSLGYGAVSIFISLPLSPLFSYFLAKKMPLSNVFRVIFFLPNIIPVVALALAFKLPFDSSYGYLYALLRSFGIETAYFSSYPQASLMVYLYCIWAGLGYNILLLSGAIRRVPKELFESAQLDGAGYFKEFTKVCVPLVWPTVVTLILLGMTSVLTLYLQPYLLLGESVASGYTIAMSIFTSTATFTPSNYSAAAAYGLLCSLIWAPIVLVTRKFVSRKYSEVDY